MKVKRTFLIIGLLALATSFSLAQSDTGKPEKKTTFGLEAAVVPNILGGYHGSVVVGYNQCKPTVNYTLRGINSYNLLTGC